MKILLTALNAKYIHSNLAVYSLKAYAEKHGEEVSLLEFTINQPEDQILRELYKAAPDVAAFSVYIWNVELVRRLAEDLHRILPDTAIWLGGPEVSYDSRKIMDELPFLSGILRGEGGGELPQALRLVPASGERRPGGDPGASVSGTCGGTDGYRGGGSAAHGRTPLSLQGSAEL